MKVYCKYDALVSAEKIKPNPRNANQHTPEQIEMLQRIVKKVGFRKPLIISNLSGYLAAGHGMLEALIGMDVKSIPVVYQDFKDEKEEFNFMTADNESQRHSWLDFDLFNKDIEELYGTDFEIDYADFGIAAFETKEDIPVDNPQPPENTPAQSAGQEQGQRQNPNLGQEGTPTQEQTEDSPRSRYATKTINCPDCGAKIEI